MTVLENLTCLVCMGAPGWEGPNWETSKGATNSCGNQWTLFLSTRRAGILRPMLTAPGGGSGCGLRRDVGRPVLPTHGANFRKCVDAGARRLGARLQPGESGFDSHRRLL